MVAELFRADGETDGHDENQSRFYCNFANSPKNLAVLYEHVAGQMGLTSVEI